MLLPSSSKLIDCHALVLGGGITGITTALVLQSLGLKTIILTDQVPMQARGEVSTPSVPTSYAMASAYPHNLRVDNLLGINDDSQAIFKHLAAIPNSGVHQYRMYEVFEEEPEEPPLSERRIAFQKFDGKPEKLKQTINPPYRPEAGYLWGWSFNTYYADMPRYLAFLWSLYKERDGQIEIIKKIDLRLEHVLEVAAGRPIVNCLGHGAVQFVQDDSPSVIMRGKQVIVPDAPLLKDRNGLPLAYNYTATKDVFARADGNAEYIHFFPRSDGWILGQTREPGKIDEHGNWQGQEVDSPTKLLNGCAIPLPIIDLNRSILKNWLGKDLAYQNLVGREGYRYYRDPYGQGVRLGPDSTLGNTLIHNYGHGGSGITMSWGCAWQCAKDVQAQGALRNQPGELTEKIIGNIFGSTSDTWRSLSNLSAGVAT